MRLRLLDQRVRSAALLTGARSFPMTRYDDLRRMREAKFTRQNTLVSETKVPETKLLSETKPPTHEHSRSNTRFLIQSSLPRRSPPIPL